MWKDIPTWENLYQINDKGEVKSLRSNKMIKYDINSVGYLRVRLYNGNRKERLFVHKIVAQVFIPNPHNFQEVNHKDENKANNNVNNLEWCDRKYNERENHRSEGKLYRPFKVYFNNGIIKNYEFAIDLANELNVTDKCVQQYCRGVSHGYLTKGIQKIVYLIKA